VQSTIVRQQIGPEDVIHVAIPVGHTFGYFYGVRCALQSGARLVLQDRWDAARAADVVSRWNATVSLGPAACIVDFLSLPSPQIDKLSSLRVFTQSGDALPAPVAERAATTLPFRISRALGMTEFGHVASTDASSPPQRVFDSAGSPQPGIVIEIVDHSGQLLPNGQEGRVRVAARFCLLATFVPIILRAMCSMPEGSFSQATWAGSATTDICI
jgi:cyclohexanecarboxylate-CoA ligase